jgi:hypothetical protein
MRHFEAHGNLEEGVPMALIELPDVVPDIRGLLASHPATATPMGELAFSTPIR